MEYEIGNAPALNFQALLDDTARDLDTTAAATNSVLQQKALVDLGPLETGLDLATVSSGGAGAGAELQGAEAQVQVQTLTEAPDQDPSSRLSRMYPNSIHTADLKHVVDNLLGECLGVMKSRLGSVQPVRLKLGLSFKCSVSVKVLYSELV